MANKKINSRNKGAAGEREFANVLCGHGLDANRGQQHAGGADSPDVVCEPLDDIHFEVKRVEAGSIYKWLQQAKNDAGDAKMPVVAHRRSREDWVVILSLEDFINILKYHYPVGE